MSEIDFHLDSMYEDDPEPVSCRRCGKKWLYWHENRLIDEEGKPHVCRPKVMFEPET